MIGQTSGTSTQAQRHPAVIDPELPEKYRACVAEQVELKNRVSELERQADESKVEINKFVTLCDEQNHKLEVLRLQGHSLEIERDGLQEKLDDIVRRSGDGVEDGRKKSFRENIASVI